LNAKRQISEEGRIEKREVRRSQKTRTDSQAVRRQEYVADQVAERAACSGRELSGQTLRL
jgi:hypothetical protein